MYRWTDCCTINDVENSIKRQQLTAQSINSNNKSKNIKNNIMLMYRLIVCTNLQLENLSSTIHFKLFNSFPFRKPSLPSVTVHNISKQIHFFNLLQTALGGGGRITPLPLKII